MVRKQLSVCERVHSSVFVHCGILDDSEVTDVCFIVLNNNGSVLSVGWDKYINVFKDDRERLKQICDPEERFGANAQQTVHKEDILCIAKSKGDLIATGDYGGTTIVWNMSSKKMFATLKSIDESKISPDGMSNSCDLMAIESLLKIMFFLNRKSK